MFTNYSLHHRLDIFCSLLPCWWRGPTVMYGWSRMAPWSKGQRLTSRLMFIYTYFIYLKRDNASSKSTLHIYICSNSWPYQHVVGFMLSLWSSHDTLLWPLCPHFQFERTYTWYSYCSMTMTGYQRWSLCDYHTTVSSPPLTLPVVHNMCLCSASLCSI